MKQLRHKAPRLTERDYIAAREQLIAKLEAVSKFADTDLSKDDRIRKGAEDAFYFARTYLPHYFSTATQAEYHPDLVEACQIEEEPTVITGNRGGAKSMIVSFLELIRDFCYNREAFIVLNMNSKERAELYTQRVLVELQHNARIKEDFGQLVSKVAARDNFSTRRTKERPTRTTLMAWGEGMSMRGLAFEQSRPSKIVCEDLQDRESAMSPKRTKKLMQMLKLDWLGAMRNKHWKFIVVGNVICEGSLIDLLFKEEEHWKKFKFTAEVTENGIRRSTWPEQYSLEALDKLRATMGDAGYEAEYLCEPRETDAEFQSEWFRHWLSLPEYDPKKVFGIVDPSLSDVGDNKAIVVGVPISIENAIALKDFAGKPYEAGQYNFLLRIRNRKSTIDEMIAQIYALDKLFNRIPWWFDGTFGQKAIFRRELARASIKYGYHLKVSYYNLRTDKNQRILGLQPEIQGGWLVFPPETVDGRPSEDAEDVKTTKRQFIRLGMPGMNDDGPDGVAAFTEISRKKVQKKAKFYH